MYNKLYIASSIWTVPICLLETRALSLWCLGDKWFKWCPQSLWILKNKKNKRNVPGGHLPNFPFNFSFKKNIYIFPLTKHEGLWHIGQYLIALQHWVQCWMSRLYSGPNDEFVMSLPFTSGWLTSAAWVAWSWNDVRHSVSPHLYPKGTIFRVTGQGVAGGEDRLRQGEEPSGQGVGSLKSAEFDVSLGTRPQKQLANTISTHGARTHLYIQLGMSGQVEIHVRSWTQVAKQFFFQTDLHNEPFRYASFVTCHTCAPF